MPITASASKYKSLEVIRTDIRHALCTLEAVTGVTNFGPALALGLLLFCVVHFNVLVLVNSPHTRTWFTFDCCSIILLCYEYLISFVEQTHPIGWCTRCSHFVQNTEVRNNRNAVLSISPPMRSYDNSLTSPRRAPVTASSRSRQTEPRGSTALETHEYLERNFLQPPRGIEVIHLIEVGLRLPRMVPEILSG